MTKSKQLTGVDNLFILLEVILLLVGASMIIWSRSATGNDVGVLLGIGCSLIAGALIAGAQTVHGIVTRPIGPGKVEEGAGPPRVPVPPTVQTAVEHGVEVIPRYSQLDIPRLVRRARKRVDVFVVSGRHLLSPQLRDILLEKVNNPQDECKIRVLALDSINRADVVKARGDMMNLPGVEQHQANYAGDLRLARLYARQVSEDDPTHSSFDMRFYDKLPTTFFLSIDDDLYVTFLLSQPVAACPVLRVNQKKHPELAKAFNEHFDHYWNSTRFFVSLIALDDEGRAMMVKNRKRGWEWPAGYIEPNERAQESAVREFREETGYEVEDVRLLAESSDGKYFVGRLGAKVGQPSGREVAEVRLCAELPDELSFADDRSYFDELLARAERWRKSRGPLGSH